MVLQSCHVDAKVSRSSVQWNTVSAGGGGVWKRRVQSARSRSCGDVIEHQGLGR